MNPCKCCFFFDYCRKSFEFDKLSLIGNFDLDQSKLNIDKDKRKASARMLRRAYDQAIEEMKKMKE